MRLIDRPTRVVLFCLLLVFLLSVAVRVLVWQNNKLSMSGVQWVLVDLYTRDAMRLANGDFRSVLTGPDPPSNADPLLHPPGYPIFLAAIYSGRDDDEAAHLIQILVTSLSPLVIFLIALGPFGVRAAIAGGVLCAAAPQFAYHSGLMLPDALSVLPILVAVYVLVRAKVGNAIILTVVCGIALGISCWLRANALILPVFLAGAALLWLPKTVRARGALTILLAFFVTISPIFLRNYLVFGTYAPLSLGAGTTLLEGLGDYGLGGEFPMPKTDEEVMRMDVRRSGRDYYGSLYAPDGVERDRARVHDAMMVIVEDPGSFAAAVAHRGSTMLRMERVPAIAPERDERETTPPALYTINRPLKFFQRGFITAVILPIALAGFFLLVMDKRRRGLLLVLGSVPLYYMTVQAMLHTEYRYALPVPHILMIFAAVAISELPERLLRLIRLEGGAA